jgi:hypothetical protein
MAATPGGCDLHILRLAGVNDVMPTRQAVWIARQLIRPGQIWQRSSLQVGAELQSELMAAHSHFRTIIIRTR